MRGECERGDDKDKGSLGQARRCSIMAGEYWRYFSSTGNGRSFLSGPNKVTTSVGTRVHTHGQKIGEVDWIILTAWRIKWIHRGSSDRHGII